MGRNSGLWRIPQTIHILSPFLAEGSDAGMIETLLKYGFAYRKESRMRERRFKISQDRKGHPAKTARPDLEDFVKTQPGIYFGVRRGFMLIRFKSINLEISGVEHWIPRNVCDRLDFLGFFRFDILMLPTC